MIIGISGKIGSGKDTIGQIIQYLTTNKETLKINPVFNQGFEYTMEYLKQKKEFAFHNSNWKVKKFAGKLKEIVALLTGCTVEDLESQDFKMKNLSKEWEYVLDESGKPVSISKYEHDEIFIQNPQRFTKNYTYRELLQFIGTNALRDIIHEQIWVNALFADYKKLNDVFIGTTQNKLEEWQEGSYPNWIITDMRFPNEFDAIKSKEGITIRINRDNGTRAIDLNPHPSEIALDNHNFDYVIENDGDLSDLVNKVKEILTLEKILN